MENTVTTIYLFKALVILVGLAFVYMGYKLFIKGITAPAGSFTGEVGDKRLKLVRFAPGIFFALVGSVVVVVGATRKFSMQSPDGRRTDSETIAKRGAAIELESAGSATEEEAATTGEAGVGGFSLCDTCDVP